jgi:hypothetical protein
MMKKSVCKQKKEKPKILKSDLIETYLKWDNSSTSIFLKLYLLDVLRIAEICRASGNNYYYGELRWFVEQVMTERRDLLRIDFNRDLPRICLKVKAKWELEEISQRAL